MELGWNDYIYGFGMRWWNVAICYWERYTPMLYVIVFGGDYVEARGSLSGRVGENCTESRVLSVAQDGLLPTQYR